MTLRPVNDALAAEFVSDFYRNWLDRAPGLPADPASALRRTQLDWIGSGPEKRDPRHWAPYVLVERK
jgi:CHAT domain-containing protein